MDEKEIIRIYSESVKRSRIILALALLGIVVFMFGVVYTSTSKNMIISILGIVIFVGTIIANAVVWRCPACKKSLPTRVTIKDINYCYHCGVKLK